MAKRRQTASRVEASQRETEDVARVKRRFKELINAGVAIFSEHAVSAVLQRAVDAARHVVGARYAAVGVLADGGKTLSQFVTSGMTPAQRERIGDLPTGRGLLGLVIRDAKPIRTPDINRHPARYGFPPSHPPMKSFLGVPVIARGRAFGNLYLTEKIGAAEFDAEDEEVAVFLATLAGAAVDNAMLHEASLKLLGQVQGMQRQRDLFFAMMNHELRNALTGVYGWAERLVHRKGGEGSSEQAALEVYEGAERTITLLNNFLDLTRLDAGKVRPVVREVDVRAEVGRAFTTVRPAAEAKHLVLEDRCAPGVASLRTDPVRLEQILVNLLNNAIRHSPEGETITLEAVVDGDGVAFRVEDRGPGIPADVRARIFEPFERFDPHSGVGTGLGLPVSRRLAEVLGGRLQVENRSGPGATFLLVLPQGPAT